MSNQKFTKEELELIKYYSVQQPVSRSLIFFICVLAAPVGFAVYGALNRDAVAMFVAFAGLLVFVIWYLGASMKNEKALNKIFNKILENELSK